MDAKLAVSLFRELLKQGKSPLEAEREFNIEDLRAALNQDIMEYGSSELLDLMARAGREERNEKDMEQALELWMAGWTSENPSSGNCDVMSWYWRRPPKRAGKPGRRYLSTNQAYNAMKRAA